MDKNNLKFIFWGTPDIASKTLEILKLGGYLPSLIITSQDKPQGRKMTITPTPVKTWAEENNIPYLQPIKIDDNFIELIKKMEFDLSIVVAYGKILPEKIINTPKKGTLNIHYSLLPKYRGASPLESALLNGENITGVTIQKMAYQLDSGPIVAKEKIDISIEETKQTLKDKLVIIGADLLIKILPDYISDKILLETQKEEGVSFCSKIKKEDGEINLDDKPILNWNKYRSYLGWPGVFFFKTINGKKTRFKITKARFEDGLFIIEKVIPEGKKEINYK